jgi:DNA polymerase-3 subunit gamma/tau
VSYLVLARKFRPATFDEVIGQGHITRTLQNAISSGRVGHAFLFSGPRGVGKTTTARILAKALNCTQGPTPTPCNQCTSCQQITAGSYLDVVEIDGASNNSVDDIRELREKVRYTPASGRYKIYIIDEVHMLSTSAFNALLKTLEEPPAHVKFVFATTEPHKLPATIISRCQRFDFRRIPLADIIANLADISAREGIGVSRGGLHRIARAAEGSLRDAQSILDQVVSSSGQQVEDADIDRVLGVVDRVLVESVAEAVLCRDGRQVLQLLDQLVRGGCNPVYFAQAILGHFRNLLLLKLCQQPDGLLEVTDEELKVLQQQADKVSTPELIQWIKIMLEDEEPLRRGLNSRVMLEVMLLKLTEVKPLLPVEEILARLAQLEDGTAGGTINPPPPRTQAAPPPARTPPVQTAAGSADGIPGVWREIVAGVRSRKPSLGSILEHGAIINLSGQEILIGFEMAFFKQQAEDAENRQVIEGVVRETLGAQMKIGFAQQPLKKASADYNLQDGGRKPHHHQQVKDPLIKRALSLFEGRVVKEKDIDQQPIDFVAEAMPDLESESILDSRLERSD